MKVFEQVFVALLFSAFAHAQAEAPVVIPPKPLLNTVELDYRLFSPEMAFFLGNDSVAIVPKSAGQPGVRFTRENFTFAFNQSLFTQNATSTGFDLSYSWDHSFVQAYRVSAKGYKVTLNPSSDKKVELGDRLDMTGSSSGLLYLKGLDETSHFHLMTNHGPRDLELVSTPLQYIYNLVFDQSVFEDSTAFVFGDTARRKQRTSLIPGFGAMISQSTQAGYVFSSCTLGIGVIRENMDHTTGVSEEKSGAVHAISCLLNLVLQKQLKELDEGDLRWFAGLSANVQLITPFDGKLLAQRMYLASAFLGTQF